MLRLDWLIWFLSFKLWVLLISILVNNEDIVLGLLHPTLNEALAGRVSSTEDKGSLVVRVTLRQYSYCAGEETIERGVQSQQYWSTSDCVSSTAIAEPMTLCDLYAAMDVVVDRKPPSPDTAQDIITRT